MLGLSLSLFACGGASSDPPDAGHFTEPDVGTPGEPGFVADGGTSSNGGSPLVPYDAGVHSLVTRTPPVDETEIPKPPPMPPHYKPAPLPAVAHPAFVPPPPSNTAPTLPQEITFTTWALPDYAFTWTNYPAYWNGGLDSASVTGAVRAQTTVDIGGSLSNSQPGGPFWGQAAVGFNFTAMAWGVETGQLFTESLWLNAGFEYAYGVFSSDGLQSLSCERSMGEVEIYVLDATLAGIPIADVTETVWNADVCGVGQNETGSSSQPVTFATPMNASFTAISGHVYQVWIVANTITTDYWDQVNFCSSGYPNQSCEQSVGDFLAMTVGGVEITL
jgi:hypothetical protein